MKKLLFSLSFLLASAMVTAAPRSLSQMKSAAESALKVQPVAATRGGSAQLEVMKQGRQYTVLGYKTGGFAVIANDDEFNAVIGYSDREFSTDNLPPAMLWWMEAADEAMTQRLASGGQTVSAAEMRSSSYPEAVEPLMVSEWDQSAPYNNIVSQRLGATVYTGCVATAMAQIMYYHRSPTRGTGGKNYIIESEDPSTNGKRLAVSFNSAYDWDNMLPTYTTGSYNTTQANAVATLMLHCGVAVEMSYGTALVGGSGAFDYNVALAANQYFGYAAKLYTRDVYSTEQWMDMIFDEISNGRPVYYGGVTAQEAGHAFVFDGYNEEGLVHVNWGWSGSGNGYFDVALLNSSTGGSYSYQQSMVVMHPGGQPEIPYTSQWGLLDWALQDIEGSFTVTVNGTQLTFQATQLYNLDAEDFEGNLGLLAEPVDGGTATVLTEMEVTTGVSNIMGYLGGYSHIGNTVSIAGLPDGTYRVYLASKATTETDWQPVHSNENIVNNYILTIRNGSASVEEGKGGWTTGIESVNAGAAAGDGTVRVYTADGVLVYTAPASEYRLEDVPATGLLIVKNGVNTVKVVK